MSAPRILVVDDSETGRDIADAMLSMGGYEVVGAGSGWEACGYLQVGIDTDEPPRADAILLDVVMPGTDGIQTCAMIRKDERFQDIPIIMVTAVDEMGSLANAFVAGATDYVTKPLNRTEILARVRAALRLKEELDKRRARERELLSFMSIWVDRRAGQWIDAATGFMNGEIAEAYLIATSDFSPGRDTSIIALAVDGLGHYRDQGEAVADGVMAKVADAVRGTAADIGVVAAIYESSVVVLIAPDHSSKKATELAESLREQISLKDIKVSTSVVTGRPADWSDRVHLLTRAVSTVPRAVHVGNGALRAYG